LAQGLAGFLLPEEKIHNRLVPLRVQFSLTDKSAKPHRSNLNGSKVDFSAWFLCKISPYTSKATYYHFSMISNFKHKGLAEVFAIGRSARVRSEQISRIERRLDALAAAKNPEALNVPGFDFHPLEGKPKRYSVHVNGNWCIAFGWCGEDAIDVDLEDYH
jgi:proteic killer suppression protein